MSLHAPCEAYAASPTLQQLPQILPGVAGRILRHLFWRALRHDRSACGTAFGSQVDDPVGSLDHVEVVLNDGDGVARVAQLMQNLEQQLDVGEMQAGGGLVKNVECAPGVASRQFMG